MRAVKRRSDPLTVVAAVYRIDGVDGDFHSAAAALETAVMKAARHKRSFRVDVEDERTKAAIGSFTVSVTWRPGKKK